MQKLTDAQAAAEGLTLVPTTIPAAALTAADRIATSSRIADSLAAAVEALLSAGQVRRSDLLALSDGLGSLHVELDELADERRQLEASRAVEENFRTPVSLGSGSGKTHYLAAIALGTEWLAPRSNREGVA